MATAELSAPIAGTVLHVENDSAFVYPVRNAFKRQGIPYDFVGLPTEAIAFVASSNVAAVIIDLRLPHEDQWGAGGDTDPPGVRLVRYIRDRWPDIEVFVLTNYPEDPALLVLVESGILRKSSVFAKGDLDLSAFAAAVKVAVTPSNKEDNDAERYVTSVLFGRHVYHFRRPVGELELASLIGYKVEIEIEADFHRYFQSSYYKPPHEMATEESERWSRLLGFVDLERYHDDFPEPETLVGSAVECGANDIVMDWFGQGRERLKFENIHGRMITVKVGDVVTVTLTRSARYGDQWISCTVAPALGELHDADLRSIKGVDAAPEGEWPKRTDG